MTFAEGLIKHAIQLLGNPPGTATGGLQDVELRRAVSAAYYALFHRLSEASVGQLAPYASPPLANRVHRWFDHAEMKKICREFASVPLRSPLKELLGHAASNDMQIVAVNFIKLQEARHSADYDLDFRLSWAQARELVTLAVNAMGAWERAEHSAESNIFVLSLLLWKKWELVRP
jgi:hypothetical protein